MRQMNSKPVGNGWESGVPSHIRGMSVECMDQHDSYCFLLVAHLDTGFFFQNCTCVVRKLPLWIG